MSSSSGLLENPGLGAVWDALPEARVVGGAVRDTLTGRPVADIDLATPRRPDGVIEALRAAGLGAVPTGLSHGTITAISAGRGFEVTTLRRDLATDGRHAEVAFTDDFQADAARRDFTFNAMFLSRAGELSDWFDGAADLAAGRVRFVGDPATRIAEDFLRVLRFFRFFARYAREPADAATLDALAAGVPGLARLSAERVWSELKRLLAAPYPTAAIRLMAELGVLAAVLPEATGIDAPHALAGPADPLLRLAALLRPDADLDRFADRLKLSGAERERLGALRVPIDPAVDDTGLRRALADAAPDIVAGRLLLAGAPAATLARAGALAIPVFPLLGRDLLALGIPPGPELGRKLADLRREWLAEGCLPDAAELARRLAR